MDKILFDIFFVCNILSLSGNDGKHKYYTISLNQVERIGVYNISDLTIYKDGARTKKYKLGRKHTAIQKGSKKEGLINEINTY
jgi:hypothetical protein